MDYEQAIKILHPDTTAEALVEIEYYGGFHGRAACIEAVNDASILACEAMSKQIPKDVLYAKELDGSYEGEVVGICPDCGKSIHSFKNSDCATKYCKNCGQALEWKTFKADF